MLHIGQYNELEIVKEVDFGLYLDGGPYGEILLPKSYTNESMKVGEDVKVFIYNDSEDRIIATTQVPKIKCDSFAPLIAKEITGIGAFMDWGIDGKDLLVPFSEQRQKMQRGETYLVHAYLDEATNRIVGSTKLNRFLKEENDDFEDNQAVEITIAFSSPIGYKAIINGTHLGLLYQNEVFKQLKIGQQETAYIKQIREDLRIDLSLQRQGYRQQIPDASQVILDKLQQAGGFLPLHDKSSPEAIHAEFAMSKKAFKKAIGALYKQKIITIQPKKGIQLANS